MNWTQTICAWTAFALAASAAVARAQQTQSELGTALQQDADQQAIRQADVVATVNGDPISRQEVQANVQAQLEAQPEQIRQADPDAANKVRQQVIDSLIEARLVEQYVREEGPDVEEQEVEAVIEQLKLQLAQHGTQFEEFLAARGHTEESFEKRVVASVAWQKFQQEQLTDENLQHYYQQHQEQFADQNPELLRQQLAQAFLRDLWDQIVRAMKPEAEIEMADAARRRPPQGPDLRPFDP